MKEARLGECRLSYAVVSIMDPQNSGKNTLLNHLFGTNFREPIAFKRKVTDYQRYMVGEGWKHWTMHPCNRLARTWWKREGRAGWETRDWVECNGEKHQRETWLACNSRGESLSEMCMMSSDENQWLALGLVQRLTLARVAPTWGPFPSAGDQCWSAGLTWTDQLSNVDLHVCGYDVLFCCSVQCILPYEFPVHLIQFQIFFWDNTVSEFRDSFVALHSITLFMSVHVTSVGRCLHCFQKYTISCCRVHMHLLETLSLQLENQDFLQQRWFNMASLFKTTLLWSLSLFILIFVVFPHCDLCWMAALHEDDIIKKL